MGHFHPLLRRLSHSRPLFFIKVFSIRLSGYICFNKSCWWLDSNPDTMALDETNLLNLPQPPLPYLVIFNSTKFVEKCSKTGWDSKSRLMLSGETDLLTLSVHKALALTSIVKTRQSDRWRHLLAISCNEQDIRLGGSMVQCIGMLFALQNFTARRLRSCLSILNNMCPWP